MKVQSFYCPDDKLLDKVNELKWKERKSFSQICISALIEYLEKHGDGNPNFTIEQFIDPNFKATPALFRSRGDWITYLELLNTDRVKEIEHQLGMIMDRVKMKLDHGSAKTEYG